MINFKKSKDDKYVYDNKKLKKKEIDFYLKDIQKLIDLIKQAIELKQPLCWSV